MRIISEVVGFIVFLGLVGLGIGWIIDNVEIRKAGGKLWSTISAMRGNNPSTPHE